MSSVLFKSLPITVLTLGLGLCQSVLAVASSELDTVGIHLNSPISENVILYSLQSQVDALRAAFQSPELKQAMEDINRRITRDSALMVIAFGSSASASRGYQETRIRFGRYTVTGGTVPLAELWIRDFASPEKRDLVTITWL